MKKAILVILDGWGIGQVDRADAIKAGDTPFVDSLYTDYPNSTLITHGEEVGLPAGQMGNSEVGHLNIGAGRIVYQELARINKSIRENKLKDQEAIEELVTYCKSNDKSLHLIGLVSDGGVHSHIDHLLALIDLFDDQNISCNVHAFLDGRDTDPKGGLGYLRKVIDHWKVRNAKLNTVIGRYYAMDRDLRWERTKKAYDLLVNGEGQKSANILDAIEAQYQEGITDEFMVPIIIPNAETIKSGDAVLFFNFRTDRPRQITRALTQEDFPIHGMSKMDLKYVTMTNYDDTYRGIDVVFTKDVLSNTLGEVLSDMGYSQIRIAETEKYPHVTFFFSGGREQAFDNEKRIMIPSPKVATYDLQPEMSAKEVTEAIIEEIMSNHPDFVCLNFANADMVGHTGIFEASMKAVHTVDQCLKELVNVALEDDYEMIVIADHGNSDYMINEDGSPNTAHTKNPVPVFYISKEPKGNITAGTLADVAPTLLDLMEIQPPKEMTGRSLILKKKN